MVGWKSLKSPHHLRHWTSDKLNQREEIQLVMNLWPAKESSEHELVKSDLE